MKVSSVLKLWNDFAFYYADFFQEIDIAREIMLKNESHNGTG